MVAKIREVFIGRSRSSIINGFGCDVPGTVSTSINGISNNGYLVGQALTASENGQDVGFLYANGTFTILQVPGAYYTNALGVNSSGDVVGFYEVLSTPEPTSLMVVAYGLAGLAGIRILKGVRTNAHDASERLRLS
jgi:uncharacterized membrane protein